MTRLTGGDHGGLLHDLDRPMPPDAANWPRTSYKQTAKLAGLVAMRKALRQLLSTCDAGAMKGNCPIIRQALGTTDTRKADFHEPFAPAASPASAPAARTEPAARARSGPGLSRNRLWVGMHVREVRMSGVRGYGLMPCTGWACGSTPSQGKSCFGGVRPHMPVGMCQGLIAGRVPRSVRRSQTPTPISAAASQNSVRMVPAHPGPRWRTGGSDEGGAVDEIRPRAGCQARPRDKASTTAQADAVAEPVRRSWPVHRRNQAGSVAPSASASAGSWRPPPESVSVPAIENHIEADTLRVKRLLSFAQHRQAPAT